MNVGVKAIRERETTSAQASWLAIVPEPGAAVIELGIALITPGGQLGLAR